VQHRLKDLISEVHLVNLSCYSIPCIRVGVGGSSIWHGGNLVLDTQLETLSKLHY